jgi:hypothetical protein
MGDLKYSDKTPRFGPQAPPEPPRLDADGNPIKSEAKPADLSTITEQQAPPPDAEAPKPDVKEETKADRSAFDSDTEVNRGDVGRSRLPQEGPKGRDANQRTSYQQEKHQPEFMRNPEQGFGKASMQPALQNALRRDGETGKPRQKFPNQAASHERAQGQNHSLPEQPRPQAYRALLKEAYFQGPPLKGSVLQQKMQAKAQGDQVALQKGMVNESSKEILKKGDVALLFRLRHQTKDKDVLREIVRFELAKLRQESKQKIQAIRYQTQMQHKKEEAGRAGETGEAGSVNHAAREQLLGKLKKTGGESAFEDKLMQVLEGLMSVPDLPEGTSARFAGKTEAEWSKFFANALKMSGAEAEGELALNRMVEALYRGLCKKDGDARSMVVSDLTLISQGETDEARFSRIPLNDESLAELFKTMQPGDPITKEMLKQLGEKLSFIRLDHSPEGLPVLSEQQKQALLNEMRQTRNAESQRRMEDALVARRHPQGDDLHGEVPFVFAGMPFKDIRERPGKTTKAMPMIYISLFFIVVILVTLAFRFL